MFGSLSIGSLFVSLAFTTALISCVAYAAAIRGAGARAYRVGRFGFHVSVISFMFACATLMYLILTHQYQFNYVYAHSSNSLSQALLVASAYAGQEGSFTLWTLFTALIGVFVLGFAQRVRYEAEVMAPFMLVLVCLTVILVVQSPFETIYAAFPEQNIPANFIPPDGRGLNPQLENLWITIHPPILFLGFASLTVPFVFAIAGLIKRDYQRWISISLPWALFGSMVLGFGIMLGGWWAYETLGWGGFWAWDPVENSSLIPWLACVALVHTMLVQKRTGSMPTARGGTMKIGGLVKTNFLLAILAFGLVLYSTFLTRSGILGDTSVHSFVAAGDWYLVALLVINCLFVLLGIGLLIARWKDLNLAAMSFPLLSRENALGLGSAVLLASALIVLLGTSWPIYASSLGMPKIAIEPSFYNTLHLPLAIAIVLLNGLSMRLKWKNTARADLYRQVAIAAAVAALGTVGLVLLGVHDPIFIGLGFGSVLALVTNMQTGWRVLRGNPRFVGAYVSHLGVSLMMLGIIFTSRYSVTQHVRLVQGQQASMFGYTLTYVRAERTELDKTDREKYQHVVAVASGDGTADTVRPVVFWSDFNKRESAFLEPGIKYTLTKDIYLSPKALDQEGGDPTVTVHKGDKVKVPFDSSIVVRFEKFDMSRAQQDGMQGAVMEVTVKDSTYYLTSYRSMQENRTQPVAVPGTDITISMVGLNADKENLSNSEAVLMFSSASHPPPPAKPAITLDVSIKPFISFVWAGVVIMVGGFFFSILRRRREIVLYVPESEEGGTT